MRAPEKVKSERLVCPRPSERQYSPVPQNPLVGEVSGCHISEAGGKRLFPGSGDLMMQITEKWQFPPFRPRIRAAKEPPVEFGRLRLAGLIGPIYR